MAETSSNGHQELGNDSSSTLRTTTNDFSNLQVLANQLDGEVTARDCHQADDYDESGDENNESVEDNNEPQDDVESSGVQRRRHQMNISNDEYCCCSSSSQPAATLADGPCHSVIYSNFDAQEDEDGEAGRFETNMEKLNENPNLVLTVDDDDYDEDVTTATTINNAASATANMTKLSDSTNQQDEQDYIDEDFAPNQLNACSSDDECGGGECDNFDGQANDDEEEIEDSRLKNNVSKSSSNTDNANVNDFANCDDEEEPKAQNQQNDLTTVNDFNAAAVLTPANSASADKVLFQDSEEPEASSSSSLPDFGQLKITAAESENKSFVKNIDSTRPVGSPKATAPASSSLKFESVSSIEDNSNDLPTTSSAYSSRSQTISECHHQPTDSASSASLAEESASNGQQQPSSDLTGEYIDQGSSENEAHIWTETEALLLQHEQTSPSACGASAIVNVLKALNFQVDLDAISSKVKINSRIPESMASTTTLAQYLFSRSVAGMNAQELIQNIENITDSQITGRFFAFYPPRDVNLSQWLAHWIRKGAAPVALLNLQKISIWGFIPDAWHHQMIYACDADGVYLTNPIERASIETLMLELTSESVLLVRSQDVIKRFKANNTNLMDLLTMKWTKSNKEKRRWFEMNVLGQVINVLREHKANGDGLGSGGGEMAAGDHDLDSSSSNDLAATLNQAHQNSSSSEDLNRIAVVVDHHQLMHHQHAGGGAAQPFMADTTNNGYPLQTPPPPQTSHLGGSTSSSASSSMAMTSYVAIPASYVPGITLFAHRDSQLFNEILSAGELSLKKT